MTTSSEEFREWLDSPEGCHLEFKKAEFRYDFEELVKYCCALANEGGGKMILGVADKRPRAVVGTEAFQEPERTVHGLTERLRLRIDHEARDEGGKRVLIFHVPSRPLGMPVSHQGAYWMRSGESLVPMTADLLRRIFDEAGPDFSAEICAKATLHDLDSPAIEEFRARWIRKCGNQGLAAFSCKQLLADAELIYGDDITYAALILFGTRQALGRHLGQAEVIFEYRSSEASIPFQMREEFREGFFSYYERLWKLLNERNDRQSYQDGLFRYDLPTFSEITVREAILNAVSHRDYRLSGSVFIRQYPRLLEIVSPGGFPPGITPENVLDQQNPRNRRIAEAFAKCGLIERSGQGMNRIFEESIRQSKPLPDLSGSSDHEVKLVLRGQIQDPAFIRFLDKLGEDRLVTFTTADFLVIDAVHREGKVPDHLRQRLPHLIESGIVEAIGGGRGKRYLLSRRFYAEAGKAGAYTRRKGLDHETNKELLIKHLRESEQGCALAELCQVLPSLSPGAVQRLLHELREEGRTSLHGQRRWAKWHYSETKLSS